MSAYPYDVKLTVASGANAGVYGFMLVTPEGQSKQLDVTEVGPPEAQRLSTEDIATHSDFDPSYDTPFAQSSFASGVGQLEFDFKDEEACWWAPGVVLHVDGKVYLAPPTKTALTLPTVGAAEVKGFRTYVTSAGTRYDFCWADKYLFRRTGADSTTAWTLVYTEANSKPITDFEVFNGVGVIAVPTEVDANSVDFYTQSDVTAAATWTPTARAHTAFNNTNGRPKFFTGVRGTLFAAVDSSAIYYTVDPTQDGWAGPIQATVGSISGNEVGDTSYAFTGMFAVNDYLFVFKDSAGYAIDAQQNVSEVLWQWKSKPSSGNFKVVAASPDYLLYAIDPEVYAYDPGTGANFSLKLSRQPGFSVKNIHGIAADNQYIYVLATVRVPTLRSADSTAMLRGWKISGQRFGWEVLWEDTSVTETYGRIFASPYGSATRLYWAYQSGSNTLTGLMEIAAEWDETASGSFAASGSLYTSIAKSGFPGLSKRHLWCSMTNENVDASETVSVSYSTNNGASFTSLGNSGTGGSGVQTKRMEYDNVNSVSIVLKIDLAGDGTHTPVLRSYDHHQRVRFRYLPAPAISVRVADRLELLNGVQDTRTATQVADDIRTLRSEEGEILYEDFIGNSFNVSVSRVSFKATRQENPTDKGELEAVLILARRLGGLVVASLYQRIKELEAFKEEVLSGAYPQRSMLGPGAISSQFLRTKSITSSMLDVSELSSVAANTGALTVTGDLIAGSGANTLGYSPTNGLYLGNATPGSAPFRVASDGTMVATTATLTGTVTANTLTANNAGSIAGWDISSTKLSQGNTGIGNSGVYRFWSGNLGSPSLSNFSVDSSGNIKSAGGTIAGMSVYSAKMTVGNAGVGSSGGYNFWSGNSTPSSAPFRVSTAGALTSTSATVTGAVTATSGSFTGSITTSNIDANGGTLAALTVDGTITLGTGGKITDADGSFWDSTGITLISSGSFGDSIKWKSGGSDIGSIYVVSGYIRLSYNSGGFVQANGTAAILSGPSSNTTFSVDSAGALVRLSDSAGSSTFEVANSSAVTKFGVNSFGDLIRPIANDSTAVGAYYGRIPIYINGSLKYLAVYS